MLFRNLVFLSATLCTTAAFAAGPKKVEVPFSFVAKHHAYQAGSYTVSVDRTRSLVTLSAIGKPSLPLTWLVMPGGNDRSHSRVSLTFDVTGPDRVLRTIQYETLITPNLNSEPKHKVEGTNTVGE